MGFVNAFLTHLIIIEEPPRISPFLYPLSSFLLIVL